MEKGFSWQKTFKTILAVILIFIKIRAERAMSDFDEQSAKIWKTV